MYSLGFLGCEHEILISKLLIMPYKKIYIGKDLSSLLSSFLNKSKFFKD